jgi:hypothetical protein
MALLDDLLAALVDLVDAVVLALPRRAAAALARIPRRRS